jgi:hypothetical protein
MKFGFEILIVLSVKFTDFRVVTPCNLVHILIFAGSKILTTVGIYTRLHGVISQETELYKDRNL